MKTKIRNKIRNDSPMSVFIIGRWPMPGLCSGFGKASEHDWQQVCGSVSYRTRIFAGCGGKFFER